MTAQISSRSLRPAPALGANIMTVASGKGGVGKTWFATTLTHALARAGASCLLFDGDLGLANVDIQLGLDPAADIGQVIAFGRDIKSAVTRFPGQDGIGAFDVIAGKSGSGALAGLARPQLKALKNELMLVSRGYDHVILDLGAGIDANVTALTVESGRVVIVITEEPTSLTDAYALVKTLALREARLDLHVVVNQAETLVSGKRAYETLKKAAETFLSLSPALLGIVRRDRHVPESIRRQAPILARHPQSEAARDVDSIARSLTF
jgi:flagellar biosynthesis protein FlhG